MRSEGAVLKVVQLTCVECGALMNRAPGTKYCHGCAYELHRTANRVEARVRNNLRKLQA